MMAETSEAEMIPPNDGERNTNLSVHYMVMVTSVNGMLD